MSILIDSNTKAIVQGITGHQGKIHTKIMINYGTKIVAGVTPGKGSEKINGIPVYNTVKLALKKHDATWSVIFVPAKFAKQAAMEALQNKLNIVLITEHMPVHDALAVKHTAIKQKCVMIGPNSPGIIVPAMCKIGIMPDQFFKKGDIGVISRSGTLTYEIVNYLTKAGYGQSTVVGIGGDAVNGVSFIDIIKRFAKDKQTKAIVIIGEIGGQSEEDAAEYIKQINYIKKYNKPIIAYIAGVSSPSEKQMGHAGALIQRNKGTALSKISALKKAGVTVVELPQHIVKALKNIKITSNE